MAKELRSLKSDVRDLLVEVIEDDYHDFKSKKYATPKMALVERLEELINNTKQGKYDETI